MAKPIFLNGRLVAFAGSVAHSPDIGGRIRSAEARDVFEEGLPIPPVKAVVAGVPGCHADAPASPQHPRAGPVAWRPARAMLASSGGTCLECLARIFGTATGSGL